MAPKTKVYLDTSGFIAFLDKSDSYFPVFARLFSNPPPLITTSLVIAEGHGWFLKRYNSYRALEFLDFISKLPHLQILSIGSEEIEKSKTYLQKFSDQKLTLVDACGLWIIQKQKIKICWSTDRHLSLTGAQLVINHC